LIIKVSIATVRVKKSKKFEIQNIFVLIYKLFLKLQVILKLDILVMVILGLSETNGV
jgi:hypothetical protein